jgi:hypothetical protein
VILIEEAEKRELTALTRKQGAPQEIAERGRTILTKGLMNKEIAEKPSVLIPSGPHQTTSPSITTEEASSASSRRSVGSAWPSRRRCASPSARGRPACLSSCGSRPA